jgi:hypothetical protein
MIYSVSRIGGRINHALAESLFQTTGDEYLQQNSEARKQTSKAF